MENTGPSSSTTHHHQMMGMNNIINNNNILSQDFIFQDFMDESNFDQFISLIREDNINQSEVMDTSLRDFGSMVGTQFGPIPLIPSQPVCNNDLYHDGAADVDLFNILNVGGIGDILSTPDTAQDQVLQYDDQDDQDEEDYSSATTMTRTTGGMRGSKSDRSRTLVSERKRRGRMKEKLYSLRALVPNITKMDKASIVGDAVLYVQDLQQQSKKLKAEIANLQSSSSLATGERNGQRSSTDTSNISRQSPSSILLNQSPFNYSIIEMDMFKVEERGLYVRVGCNRGKGVAVSLYKALESLTTTFNILNSNLATATADQMRFIFTFTLNVRSGPDDQEEAAEMNLQTLKLWIAGAFMNQGFHFKFQP